MINRAPQLLLTLLFNSLVVLHLPSAADAIIVSKCHHEGDFTVSCNKTKMPSSPDIYEVMRYAKLINGLYYNDTLCAYLPNTSCARKSSLTHCVDQPSCTVKNSWFSLEPHCAGNSYYSQLEYDCQPVFNMCGDREAAFNSVIFSGIVLSPSYPFSYRTEQSRTCYLTINLPKNHHAEITLDYFDIARTNKCIGDYLEVQQYAEVSDTNSIGGETAIVKSLSKIFNDPRKNKDAITSTVIKNEQVPLSDEQQDLINRRVPVKSKQQKMKSGSKSSRHQKKTKFRWQTLRTACGKINGSITFRASADIISFKFRSLGSDYLTSQASSSSASASLLKTGSNNMGFKIFFQAIPPKAPSNSEDDDHYNYNNRANINNQRTSSSTKNYMNGKGTNEAMRFEKGEHDDEDDGEQGSGKSARKRLFDSSFFKSWTFIIICISVAALLVILVALTLIILLVKRRKNNVAGKSTSPNKNSTDTNNKNSKMAAPAAAASTGTSAGKSKPMPLPPAVANLKNKAAVGVSNSSPICDSTSGDKPVAPAPAAGQAGGAIKASPKISQGMKVVMEPEPRKMQAERPVLLQDLSTSRLLLKYKQQATTTAAPAADMTTINNSDDKNQTTTTTTTEKQQEKVSTAAATQSKQSTPPIAATTPASLKSSKTSSNNNNNSPRLPAAAGGTAVLLDNGGVYGTDIYDGGGVYGACLVETTTTTTVTTSAATTTTANASSSTAAALAAVAAAAATSNNNNSSSSKTITSSSTSNSKQQSPTIENRHHHQQQSVEAVATAAPSKRKKSTTSQQHLQQQQSISTTTTKSTKQQQPMNELTNESSQQKPLLAQSEESNDDLLNANERTSLLKQAASSSNSGSTAAAASNEPMPMRSILKSMPLDDYDYENENEHEYDNNENEKDDDDQNLNESDHNQRRHHKTNHHRHHHHHNNKSATSAASSSSSNLTNNNNNNGQQQQQQPTTPARKPTPFNPLHVILKDKNKYYTTEYI